MTRICTSIFASLSLFFLLTACAQLKDVGESIGQNTKKVTTTIGHATRDTVKSIGKNTKEVVDDVTKDEEE